MKTRTVNPQQSPIDPELIFNRYYNLSLRYLSYRPRSEQEVYKYLLEKQKRARNLTETIIAKIMQRLVEYKFIDDVAFARFWIEHRKKGLRIIKLELRQKGVDREIVEEAIAGYDVESKQKDLINKLIEKKSRSLKNETPQKAMEKMIAYLMRKGFNYDEIKKTLEDHKK